MELAILSLVTLGLLAGGVGAWYLWPCVALWHQTVAEVREVRARLDALCAAPQAQQHVREMLRSPSGRALLRDHLAARRAQRDVDRG